MAEKLFDIANGRKKKFGKEKKKKGVKIVMQNFNSQFAKWFFFFANWLTSKLSDFDWWKGESSLFLLQKKIVQMNFHFAQTNQYYLGYFW